VVKKFAEGTEVPAERSRGEIERILMRFGADQFMYGWRGDAAVIAFRAHARHIRFLLPMPTAQELRGSRRADAKDRETRRRWRALALCIKAKLEAVATGIETFEDAFLAQMVLPNGQTMAEYAHPLVAKAYETGAMPNLLPYLQGGTPQ
jgi:hypothetical protein